MARTSDASSEESKIISLVNIGKIARALKVKPVDIFRGGLCGISARLPLVEADGKIRYMEPITAVTTTWTIAKTAGEISKKVYEFGKSIKDRDAKQQVDEILDKLRELRQSASELEDENRDLREKLRFKSADYEFHSPFWFEKARPDQPLCPKCFANKIAAPMGEPGQGCNSSYRKCLVCSHTIEVGHRRLQQPRQPHY